MVCRGVVRGGCAEGREGVYARGRGDDLRIFFVKRGGFSEKGFRKSETQKKLAKFFGIFKTGFTFLETNKKARRHSHKVCVGKSGVRNEQGIAWFHGAANAAL